MVIIAIGQYPDLDLLILKRGYKVCDYNVFKYLIYHKISLWVCG